MHLLRLSLTRPDVRTQEEGEKTKSGNAFAFCRKCNVGERPFFLPHLVALYVSLCEDLDHLLDLLGLAGHRHLLLELPKEVRRRNKN